MSNLRPPTAPQTQRRMSTNPFAAVLQEDDDIAHPPQSQQIPIPSSVTTIDSDNIENIENEDDDCSQTSQSSSGNNRRVRPPRPSMANRTSNKSMLQQQRRRRRSSARFLQLSKPTTHENDDDDDDDDEMGPGTSSQKNSGGGGTLQEMYQTAIRMNAENKINTTNSWNLHIIDQMDTLLSLNKNDDDDDDDSTHRHGNTATNHTMDVGTTFSATVSNKTPRVNFTKASCTLDASVKIYSYRVDDVHLTSYKVLANLNRTQNNNNKNDSTSDNHHINDNDDDDDNVTGKEKAQRKETGKTSSGSTLETNIANINLNKLDSAYDIDPLFHKMSKTFDEGGAKGLLLANLGVSESGCRVVFDSTPSNGTNDEKNSSSDPTMNSEDTNLQDLSHRIAEGMMDITSLTDKLKSLLSEHSGDDDEWDLNANISGGNNINFSSIRSIPLVPQLSALRTEHEKLVELGCCGPDAATALASTIGPKTPAGKVRKYHANSEQEHNADFSIHKEAIERSHRKLNFVGDDDLNLLPTSHALFPSDSNDHHDNAFSPGEDSPMNDEYGGGTFGFDDGVDDDNDDDHCFDTFIANARYSDVSLTSTPGQPGTLPTASTTALQPQPATVVANFIDAISSGTTVLSNSDYEYFSSVNTKGGKSNNEWAGAAHWKRNNTKNAVDVKSKTNHKKSSKKKYSKSSKKIDVNDVSLVDLNPSVIPDLSHVLKPPTKRKGTSSSSSTVLSKAMIAKYSNEENVLPHDVGFQHNDGIGSSSLQQLTRLFLRPNISILHPLNQNLVTTLTTDSAETLEPKKTVEFNIPSATKTTDWEYDNDDNDGPGFDFGGGDADNDDDDDEFVVPMLENVRKVDKVRVGYATVAKKVDVKRLKRDLWSELETLFCNEKTNDPEKDDEDTGDDLKENEIDISSSTNENSDYVQKSTTPLAVVSFQETVRNLGQEQSQTDITLPFYFICILHLANEKGLRLEQGVGNDIEVIRRGSNGTETHQQQQLLSDFTIFRDELVTNDNY